MQLPSLHCPAEFSLAPAMKTAAESLSRPLKNLPAIITHSEFMRQIVFEGIQIKPKRQNRNLYRSGICKLLCFVAKKCRISGKPANHGLGNTV